MESLFNSFRIELSLRPGILAASSPLLRTPLHEQAFVLIEFRGRGGRSEFEALVCRSSVEGFSSKRLAAPCTPCRNPGHARAYAASQQSAGSHCGSPLCLVPCGIVGGCEFCSRIRLLSVTTGIRENPRKPAPTLAIGYFTRKAYAYYVVLRVAAAYRCGWFSGGRAIRVRRITTKAESIPSDIRLAAHRAWHLTCSKQQSEVPELGDNP